MTGIKEEFISASKRKNRAVRKLLRTDGIDPIFKLLVLAIIDKLNCGSKYRVAWPSVPTLAKIIGRSERTTLRYLQKIYASGIFEVHRMEPQGALQFLRSRFAVEANLTRCRKYSPNIYVINELHALWNNKEKLPASVVDELQIIAGSP